MLIILLDDLTQLHKEINYCSFKTAITTEVPQSVCTLWSMFMVSQCNETVLMDPDYMVDILALVASSLLVLIRPDGVDLAIGSKSSDQFGRSGIPGEVDNKYASGCG